MKEADIIIEPINSSETSKEPEPTQTAVYTITNNRADRLDHLLKETQKV